MDRQALLESKQREITEQIAAWALKDPSKASVKKQRATMIKKFLFI